MAPAARRIAIGGPGAGVAARAHRWIDGSRPSTANAASAARRVGRWDMKGLGQGTGANLHGSDTRALARVGRPARPMRSEPRPTRLPSPPPRDSIIGSSHCPAHPQRRGTPDDDSQPMDPARRPAAHRHGPAARRVAVAMVRSPAPRCRHRLERRHRRDALRSLDRSPAAIARAATPHATTLTAMTRLAGLAQSLLRIVAGLLFIHPGGMKLLGWFGGMPAGVTMTPLLTTAGYIELIGGTLILLGLFTRPVAFIAS